MTSTEKLRARAEELDRKGRPDKALEAWRELVHVDPEVPEHWILLGERELAIGDSPRAGQSFFRAMDLLLRGGFLKEAQEMGQRALAADRQQGAARRLLGIIDR